MCVCAVCAAGAAVYIWETPAVRGLTGVELERLLALESQFHLLREVVALLENHQRVLRLGFCGRAWGNTGCSKNNLNAFCFHRLNK